MEGGRHYAQAGHSSSSSSRRGSRSASDVATSCKCAYAAVCGECVVALQCSDLGFCLQCLPLQTRMMLRTALLICLDSLQTAILKRLSFSKEDKWRRWVAVRHHREKVVHAAVWGPHNGAPTKRPPSPTPAYELPLSSLSENGGDLSDATATEEAQQEQQQRRKPHRCWGDVIPYLHIFWPFVEQQEVPGGIDVCSIAALLEQLHDVARRDPRAFPRYPLLSEIERFGGEFAFGAISDPLFEQAYSACGKHNSDEENEKPILTLGNASPLYG